MVSQLHFDCSDDGFSVPLTFNPFQAYIFYEMHFSELQTLVLVAITNNKLDLKPNDQIKIKMVTLKFIKYKNIEYMILNHSTLNIFKIYYFALFLWIKRIQRNNANYPWVLFESSIETQHLKCWVQSLNVVFLGSQNTNVNA